jgi:ornithine carbamoyltransferase/carbamoyltransferase
MAAEEHPTQGVCDLAAMLIEFGSLRGLSVLYMGEGNNTAASLAYGISRMPLCNVTFATSRGDGISPTILGNAKKWAEEGGGSVTQVHDMDIAGSVDVVRRAGRPPAPPDDPDWREKFRDFYVDERLLRRWPTAKLMHDLPAHRGEEVSGAALEGPRSIAWTQAEMKLTSAMAILEWAARDRESHADLSR